MSAAILGGLPLAAAAVAGGLACAARVALAVPRRRAGDRIDPNRVSDPWRRFVIDAQQAQARFDRTVRQCQDGPIKERLARSAGASPTASTSAGASPGKATCCRARSGRSTATRSKPDLANVSRRTRERERQPQGVAQAHHATRCCRKRSPTTGRPRCGTTRGTAWKCSTRNSTKRSPAPSNCQSTPATSTRWRR